MITINFLNNYDSQYDKYLPIYQELAEKTLDYLNKEKEYEISVNLVDNQTIKKINSDYRNLDKVTDVISFENLDFFEYEPVIELGDIFISVDKALEQAMEYQHSIEREMSFLFVHGLLHCLGYDHLNDKEEKEMFALQEVILDGLQA